jgi:hypothetical protein
MQPEKQSQLQSAPATSRLAAADGGAGEDEGGEKPGHSQLRLLCSRSVQVLRERKLGLLR